VGLREATHNDERLLYEAGYDGFWLARVLTAEAIECRVLDPASLQANRRARRAKTDRLSSVIAARQPISCHSRSNTSAGPMRRTAIVVAASSLAALKTMANRAPEHTSRSN
jgi:transposase